MKTVRNLTILIVMLFSASVFAASNIGLMGIGGKVGFVDPESGVESTFGLGAVADLGQLTDNINLEAEILYWGKTYDEHYWEWSYSQIYISALAKYCFDSKGSKLTPYVGGGLGLVLGKSKSKWKGPDYGYSYAEYSGSETDFGIHIVGGGYYQLSPKIKGFAEARYSLNGLDFWGVFAGAIFSLSK